MEPEGGPQKNPGGEILPEAAEPDAFSVALEGGVEDAVFLPDQKILFRSVEKICPDLKALSLFPILRQPLLRERFLGGKGHDESSRFEGDNGKHPERVLHAAFEEMAAREFEADEIQRLPLRRDPERPSEKGGGRKGENLTAVFW